MADYPKDTIEKLSRFLNEISQSDMPYDEASWRVQRAYDTKAQWILEYFEKEEIPRIRAAILKEAADRAVAYEYPDKPVPKGPSGLRFVIEEAEKTLGG